MGSNLQSYMVFQWIWDFSRESKSLNYGWKREFPKFERRSEVLRWFRTGRDSHLGAFLIMIVDCRLLTLTAILTSILTQYKLAYFRWRVPRFTGSFHQLRRCETPPSPPSRTQSVSKTVNNFFHYCLHLQPKK